MTNQLVQIKHGENRGHSKKSINGPAATQNLDDETNSMSLIFSHRLVKW